MNQFRHNKFYKIQQILLNFPVIPNSHLCLKYKKTFVLVKKFDVNGKYMIFMESTGGLYYTYILYKPNIYYSKMFWNNAKTTIYCSKFLTLSGRELNSQCWSLACIID